MVITRLLLIFLASVSGHTELRIARTQKHGIHRERSVTKMAKLMRMEKMCNKAGHYTPCACAPTLTTTEVHMEGKIIIVNFPEFECQQSINDKRKLKGRIPVDYKCAQLTMKRTLYRDERGAPIEVDITFKAGCELRCINANCGGSRITNTPIASIGTSRDENVRNVKTTRKPRQQMKKHCSIHGDLDTRKAVFCKYVKIF